MSADLEGYLTRPPAPVDAGTAAALAAPMAAEQALAIGDLDRLLDPEPMAVETGWCMLADGVGYVAVRTAMPGVSTEMIDWWFDWHPRDPLRYRIWHPTAHHGNSLQSPPVPGLKAHWGTVHRPVEDVGLGTVHARIEFMRPTELGMALDLPAGATVVGGYAGDERRRMRHTLMIHVFIADGDGVLLRSRFWIGAALRPYGPLGGAGARLLNNRVLRRRIIPAGVAQALAGHCSEEYANLAALLPELHRRFGPGGEPAPIS